MIPATIALALVGPAFERPVPTFRNLDGTVIAMDVSRSVAVIVDATAPRQVPSW